MTIHDNDTLLRLVNSAHDCECRIPLLIKVEGLESKSRGGAFLLQDN